MITVKNLCKDFGDNKVLKDITYTIEQGEKIVIVGPSGSGKSTFLRCLNLLETPTSGEIWFEGDLINSRKCDVDTHRRKMGMVFQQFNLFPHMTVLKNITMAPVPLKLMTQAQADEAA
ncbi:MAG: ATP-binding cassette domain-containing protein, partial [Oscillospiraceae bacterium]|nr:ATP-binding cassette domain-containing protein [Oscillospiraceae bacterium]